MCALLHHMRYLCTCSVFSIHTHAVDFGTPLVKAAGEYVDVGDNQLTLNVRIDEVRRWK